MNCFSLRPLIGASSLFTLCLLLLPSCGDDDDSAATPITLSGEEIIVGDGLAWTEVTLSANGEPTEVAVVFTEGALENLPTGSPHAHEFLLPLPARAVVPPYTHATLD
ncbi:DUF5602 domain-containing protein [Lewinella sp. IMCC34191]|uniref:DUF5602 domain-containing protein n=1 Tax=Lewinella sp. IMCC34191 TaxID=2259172 RepID=UPI000E236EAE|nr:DUF5602 domain-containing protein [Lewinella sp. IMCC34191]